MTYKPGKIALYKSVINPNKKESTYLYEILMPDGRGWTGEITVSSKLSHEKVVSTIKTTVSNKVDSKRKKYLRIPTMTTRPTA